MILLLNSTLFYPINIMIRFSVLSFKLSVNTLSLLFKLNKLTVVLIKWYIQLFLILYVSVVSVCHFFCHLSYG